jgi:hypothetical protein
MMYCKKLLCLMLVLASARGVQAETLEGLLAAGKLEARAVVQTPDPLFQKAPIVISVEVGTPGRFSKRGTRVRDFTVSGALVRSISKFAFTETRRREGDSWAFQSWRFELYSQHAGTLSTPALTTFISVDTGTNGVVEGEIKLQVPPLEIEVPPGTEGLASWLAATELEVDESWEGVLDAYEVGDAVTRIRRFTINGAPAMAIPASPQIELDGVQVYHAPALVDDKAVGGSLEGVREERVVFTIKAGGARTIPGHRIHWFNLNTKAIEQIDLPGRTLDVSGTATPDAAAAPEPRDETGNSLVWALAVLSVILSYCLLRWIGRTTWFHTMRDHLDVWRCDRRTQTEFMRAAAQQDSRRCLALLYKRMSEHAEWQLSTVCATDPQLSAISAALMAHAYSDGQPPEASELHRLWEVCAKPKEPRDHDQVLRLNPGTSQWACTEAPFKLEKS